MLRIDRSVHIPSHAGGVLPGMARSALFATAVHIAVGGALWMGGVIEGAQPIAPVSDVIMIQIVATEPVAVNEETPLPVPEPLPMASPADVHQIIPDLVDAPIPIESVVSALPEVDEDVAKDDGAEPQIPIEQSPVIFDPPIRKPTIKQQVPLKNPTLDRLFADDPEVAVALAAAPQQLTSALPATPPQPSVPQHGEGVPAQMSSIAYAHNPKPTYPREARRKRQEGVVVLRVIVGVDGRPLSVNVHTSSGHRLLDQAALRSVKRWRFRPATIGAMSVQGTVDVPIRFFLRES